MILPKTSWATIFAKASDCYACGVVVTGTRKFAAAAAIIAIYTLLATAHILTRQPMCDEGWFASPAWGLLRHATMGTPILDPTFSREDKPLTGIDRYTYWIMPLYPVAQAAWYRVMGFGLFPMRALSLFWGLILLVAWAEIVYLLTCDTRIRILASCLIAIEYQIQARAALGRMDTMCAGLGAAGLALFLRLRDRNLTLAVLVSQTLVAAAGLSHPNGIVAFCCLLYLTLAYDWRRLRPVHLAVASAPYLVAAAMWGLYIRKAPAAFLAQFTSNAAGRFIFFTSPVSALWHEFRDRYLHFYGFTAFDTGLAHLKFLLLLAYIAAVIICLAVPRLRRAPGSRHLLVIAGISLGLIAALDALKLNHYFIHTLPPLAALLALFIIRGWELFPRYRPILAGTVVVFVLLQIAENLHIIHKDSYHTNYLTAARYLVEHTSDADLIMGSAELGFAVGFDGRLLDDPWLGMRSGRRPDVIVTDTRNYEGIAGTLTRQRPEFRIVYTNAYYSIFILADDRRQRR